MHCGATFCLTREQLPIRISPILFQQSRFCSASSGRPSSLKPAEASYIRMKRRSLPLFRTVFSSSAKRRKPFAPITAEVVESRCLLSGLSLNISPNTISENGGTATVTVSRTTTSGDLQVRLSSSDENGGVSTADGDDTEWQHQCFVCGECVDDLLLDGTQSVSIGAVANGPVQIDTSFGNSGFGAINGELARDAAVLPNGQVIVTFWAGPDFGVSRLNANGTVDQTFGINGVVTIDVSGQADVPEAVVVQPDGKIVIAGIGYNGPQFDFVMARLNADGTLDSTFGNGGKVLIDMGPGSYNEIWDLALQADGRILAGGNLSNSGTN